MSTTATTPTVAATAADGTPFEQPTLEGLRALNKALAPMMDAEQRAKLHAAIATLEERGMPEDSTYSLTHITATDADDLNLKAHLAIFGPAKAFADGNLSFDAFSELAMPLLRAMLGGSDAFPVTIRVEG